MQRQVLSRIVIVALAALGLAVSACKDPDNGHPGHDGAPERGGPAPQTKSKAALAPAEGAAVKILRPGKDQVFTGDQIPLQFELVKGKRGRHVHAYVNGELMGMFESTNGTLTGVPPGKHTLQLRVATADHKTELDAVDAVNFSVRQ